MTKQTSARYSPEVRARAVRMVLEHQSDYTLGLEDRVGSLRAGKRADVVVLDEDPFEIDPMALKEVSVAATIFEGTVHAVA